ncbi:MAG: hypothetical protein LIO74_01505 [Ruminococcus sp.]|nr:hypothetical protein [Ruminococcus sp.]
MATLIEYAGFSENAVRSLLILLYLILEVYSLPTKRFAYLSRDDGRMKLTYETLTQWFMTSYRKVDYHEKFIYGYDKRAKEKEK